MKRYKQNRQTTRRVDGTKGDDTKTSARLDECERKTNGPDAVSTKVPTALRTAAKANNRSIEPIIPQNTPADLLHLLLFRVPIEAAFDIALIRPAMLPKGQRFESAEDARAQRDKDYERLDSLGQRDAARALFMCEPGNPCGRPYCATCARQFRRWSTAQTLRLAPERQIKCVTVALEAAPLNRLPGCDLIRMKNMLGQRIRRCTTVQFVVGGIEAAYRDAKKDFLIHAHLLIAGGSKAEYQALRKACRMTEVDYTFKSQKVKDRPKQFSYLLKFGTFHRPGTQTSKRRTRAVPLPSEALRRLTIWRAKYNLMDFLFLQGLRRRGGDLVRIEQKP
jgi:hypothetical protein